MYERWNHWTWSILILAARGSKWLKHRWALKCDLHHQHLSRTWSHCLHVAPWSLLLRLLSRMSAVLSRCFCHPDSTFSRLHCPVLLLQALITRVAGILASRQPQGACRLLALSPCKYFKCFSHARVALQ